MTGNAGRFRCGMGAIRPSWRTVLPPFYLDLEGIWAVVPNFGLMLIRFVTSQTARRKWACQPVFTSSYGQVANLLIEVRNQVLGCCRIWKLSQLSQNRPCSEVRGGKSAND